MVALAVPTLTDKILAGERISSAEALELYRAPLVELGALADARRNLAQQEKHNGRGREIVTYIVDRNINYTNVCNVYCKFCAFYRTEKDPDHYVLSFEQLDQKLAASQDFLSTLPNSGIDFNDLGEHRLKGKYQPVRLFGMA